MSKYRFLKERLKRQRNIVNALITMEARLNYAKAEAEKTQPFPSHTFYYKRLVEIREMALERLESMYQKTITHD